mmetsp:Transcript_142840/g.252180  ORF Transcript_142840/g.252180 Transcript_142840/m.252180 type:complete len:1006 (-) Transcript_142840:79-3096(-)
MAREDCPRLCFTYTGGPFESLCTEASKIGSLAELETLLLPRNRGLKDSKEAAALATAFSKLCNLKTLDLSSCTLGWQAASTLAPGFRHLLNLKRLLLSDNTIGPTGFQALAKEAFPSLAELKELGLDSCGIDTAAAREAAAGLRSLQKLEVLRIGGSNEFGEEGMQALGEQAFPALAATLKELDCKALQGFGEAATVEEFGNTLGKLAALCSLDVSRCGLDSSSVQHLCTGLGELSKLETLRMGYNRLGAEACRSLSMGPLLRLEALKVLDISRCAINAEAMKELAPGLGHLCSLEKLLLVGNVLEKEGCAALADASAIQRLINLQELDVSWCGLGYKPIKNLARGLVPLVKLQRLILVGNEFGTDGCEVLAETCLMHLVSLRVLDIRNCEIAKPAVEALAPALVDLQDFENLVIGWDKQTAKYVKYLKKARNVPQVDGSTEQQAAPKPVVFPKYKKLSLNSCEAAEITKDLAASLQHFPNIEILSFRGTPIIEKSSTALCEGNSLPLLLRLRELNISRCSLKPPAMKELAPGLGKLRTLQVLNMQDNELSTIGATALAEEVFPQVTDLRELVLSNCDLEGAGFSALAPGLKHLGQLTRFAMVGNEIDADGARDLTNGALPFLVKLTEFNASFCSITAEAMEELALGLKHNILLEILILSCNDFGAAGVKALAKETLKHLGRLRKLDIQLVELDITKPDFDMGILEEVVPGLAQVSTLEHLHFMGNKLGLPGTEALTVGAFPNLTRLKELDVSFCNMDKDAFLVFVPALCKLIDLETLNLRNNKFGREGAEELGRQVLAKLKKLRSIDLRMCGLDEAGIETLFPSVGQLWNLEVLELGDKRLQVDFIVTLAKWATPQLRSFKDLKLDGVELDGDQMIEVAPGLGHLTDLEVLSLRNNKLEGEGAGALATALQRLPKLRELHISQCGFDDTCIELLVPSLKQLHALEKLNFVGNPFGVEAAKLLASEVLPHLRHLKELNVMNVGVEEAGLAAMEEVVSHQAVVTYT